MIRVAFTTILHGHVRNCSKINNYILDISILGFIVNAVEGE